MTSSSLRMVCRCPSSGFGGDLAGGVILLIISPPSSRQEIKDEPPDEEEIVAADFPLLQVAPVFVDPDYGADPDVKVKKEPKVESSDPEDYYDASAPEKTFDGHWTSDSDGSFEFDVPTQPQPVRTVVTETGEIKKKRIKRKMHKITDLRSKITLAKHKFRNLRGRLACRYCDTIFMDSVSDVGVMKV
jgi:hypothetical protein